MSSIANCQDVGAFGQDQWKECYGQEVVGAPSLPESFFEFWEGEDPIDRTKRVCETHLPPILRPTYTINKGQVTAFSLNALHSCALSNEDYPMGFAKIEPGFIFQYFSDSNRYFGAPRGQAQPPLARWIVIRKEGPPSGSEPSNFGYSIKPELLDVATGELTRYITMGETCLGPNTYSSVNIIDVLSYSKHYLHAVLQKQQKTMREISTLKARRLSMNHLSREVPLRGAIQNIQTVSNQLTDEFQSTTSFMRSGQDLFLGGFSKKGFSVLSSNNMGAEAVICKICIRVFSGESE